MDVDRPRIHPDIARPYGIDETLAREDSGRMVQQVTEQPELERAHVHAASAAANPIRLQFDFDVSDFEPVRPLFIRADVVQQGPDAGDQLVGRQWPFEALDRLQRAQRVVRRIVIATNQQHRDMAEPGQIGWAY